MTSTGSLSREDMILQHWRASLVSRHGPSMIANPANLDLEAAYFDDFFDDGDKATTTRYFWRLAREARHGASVEDQQGAYAELSDLGSSTGSCMIAARARKMVAAAPFLVQSAWG